MNKPLTSLWMLTAWLVLAAGVRAQAPPAPVVLAVDVSRSLSAAELARVGETLSAFVAKLPPETPAGLLVFADQPRWIAQPAAPPTGLEEALRGLRPEGRFTLLYDALFAASSEIEDGGVVVLVTDGRDENSATTIDDITRTYGDKGIRIVAVGAGDAPAERNLRRLALLSSGSYAGSARDLTPTALNAAAAAAVAGIADRRTVAAAASREEPAPLSIPQTRESSPTASAPAPSTAAPAPGDADAGGATRKRVPWWWWAVVAAVALAALAGAALLLGRRAAAPAACRRCGTQLPAGATGECAACSEAALVERLRARSVAAPGRAVDAFLETGVVPQLSLEQRLDRTAVMIDQPALVVKEPGEPPRSFALSEDEAFSVGRESSRNTLAIPSVSLSAQHFRVVPEQGAYYLLDLQSTNGTSVNGQRVRAAKLVQGDRIRAGQVEFDFTVQQRFAPMPGKERAAARPAPRPERVDGSAGT